VVRNAIRAVVLGAILLSSAILRLAVHPQTAGAAESNIMDVATDVARLPDGCIVTTHDVEPGVVRTVVWNPDGSPAQTLTVPVRDASSAGLDVSTGDHATSVVVAGTQPVTAADGTTKRAAFAVRYVYDARTHRLVVDPTFNHGRPAQSSPFGDGVVDAVHDVALAPDGSVVVAASGTLSGTGTAQVVMRFSPTGQFDATFGSNGFGVNTAVGSPSSARAVDLRPDGAILVAGTSLAADGHFYATLFGYTASGQPDPSIGQGGYTTVPGFSNDLTSIAVDHDGSIAVGGYSYANYANGSAADYAVARLLPNGQPDPTFSSDGIHIVASSELYAEERVNAVAIDHGVITFAGDVGGSRMSAGRFTPAGDLDQSFGVGGVRSVQAAAYSSAALSLSVDNQGGVLLAGPASQSVGQQDSGLVLLTAQGSLDAGLGGGTGIVVADVARLR
jgi:uncharacterized delta-60 repeat protein